MFSAENLIALPTLTLLEIVLGIDNLVFVSILADKLHAHQRARPAPWVGPGADHPRIAAPLPEPGNPSNGAPLNRDRAVDLRQGPYPDRGGHFLLGKSTYEIHANLEGGEGHSSAKTRATERTVHLRQRYAPDEGSGKGS